MVYNFKNFGCALLMNLEMYFEFIEKLNDCTFVFTWKEENRVFQFAGLMLKNRVIKVLC